MMSVLGVGFQVPTSPFDAANRSRLRSRVSRPAMLNLIQRFLAPYLSSSEIERRCGRYLGPESGPLEEGPIAILNRLLYECPDFFEDAEERRFDAETALFEEIERREGPDQSQTLLIRQRHRVRAEDLPERCAVHLFLPVPRHLEGVQEVRLRGAQPRALADHYLATAGLVFDVPLLVSEGVPLPPLELTFEVRQWPARLSALRDGAMRAVNERPQPLPSDWQRWIESRGGAAEREPERIVVELLARMEESFEFGITGAGEGTPERLVECGVGDLHALTTFAMSVLRELGFAVRAGAGQHLFLSPGTKRSRLRLLGSTGYDHRFVLWRRPGCGASGAFDLSYFHRWHFAATDRNTRSGEVRQRFERAGERLRGHLRQGPYPLDLVVSGAAAPSQVVDLDSGEGTSSPVVVDTEVTAVRARGARR